MLIIVCGLPGSGKSYFASNFAQQLDAKYLNSDRERKVLTQQPSYQSSSKELVYDVLLDKTTKAIHQGSNILVDATFYKKSLRQKFLHIAQAAKQAAYLIEIIADDPTTRKRLALKRKYSDADYAVHQRVKAVFEPIQADHLVLKSTNDNLNEMLTTATQEILFKEQKRRIYKLIESGDFMGSPFSKRSIETHISWVIFCKQYAFKIKKQLKLPFLDYSSIEKRKEGCQNELSLNQRFSSIYLNVLPIKELGDQYSLGNNSGEVVDYAVQMKKLQEAKRMDHVLTHRSIRPAELDGLAKKIAHFHTNAKKVLTPFNLTASKEDFNDILSQEQFIAEQLGQAYLDKLHLAIQFSDAFLNQHNQLLESRVLNGYQRDLHGDLHCGNIFLYKEPILFDCIEFNPHFRQIDILNEIAFLAMDLESKGFKQYSDQFTTVYLNYLSDPLTSTTLQLLNYYKCYRANIRAKVSCIRANQMKQSNKAKAELTQIKKYLDLMHSYSVLYT